MDSLCEEPMKQEQLTSRPRVQASPASAVHPSFPERHDLNTLSAIRKDYEIIKTPGREKICLADPEALQRP